MAYTKNNVTIISFLIGIRMDVVRQIGEENPELIEKLMDNKSCRIIRYLCKLRTNLMMNFKNTDTEMRMNLKNIDKLPWFDTDNVKQLEEWGIHIIKPNGTSAKYMESINKYISDNISNCKELFPEYVNWSYIKDIFTIPKFTQERVMKNEFAKYMAYREFYPFQQYIHWQPEDCGGILFNDSKFFSVIYRQHNDMYISKSNYRDADEEVKERIYEFINDTDSIEIVVDCENSNPYKLCSVIAGLKRHEISKVQKIILFDDIHTDPGWDMIDKFVSIPVEHIMVDRVKEQKSLVDIKMTATVCMEHYQNRVSSFLLFSSDSDYWGLISSLPNAHFLMMFEYSKVSEAIKRTLAGHEIYFCAIDDFGTGKIDEFKKFVLFRMLKKYLPDLLQYNGKELVTKIYHEAKIPAEQNEMDNFYNKYIKTLKFVADDSGKMYFEIAK